MSFSGVVFHFEPCPDGVVPTKVVEHFELPEVLVFQQAS